MINLDKLKNINKNTKFIPNTSNNGQFVKYEVGGIIVGGVGHNEQNNIGDRGVPVVDSNYFMKSGGKYNKNTKSAEIEDGEIMFNVETAEKIEELVNKYTECKCQLVLEQLGQLLIEALKKTKDMNCERAGKCNLTPLLPR